MHHAPLWESTWPLHNQKASTTQRSMECTQSSSVSRCKTCDARLVRWNQDTRASKARFLLYPLPGWQTCPAGRSAGNDPLCRGGQSKGFLGLVGALMAQRRAPRLLRAQGLHAPEHRRFFTFRRMVDVGGISSSLMSLRTRGNSFQSKRILRLQRNQRLFKVLVSDQ